MITWTRCPFNEHAIRNLPNWRVTHWLVALLNYAMRKSESRHMILVRYRKPRKGTGPFHYSVPRHAARRVSLYVKDRPAYERWERARRQYLADRKASVEHACQQQRALQRLDRENAELRKQLAAHEDRQINSVLRQIGVANAGRGRN